MAGSGQRQRKQVVTAAIFLAVVTLLAFWPVLGNDFINLDDQRYVLENPNVQRGVTAESMRWAWTSVYAAMWQPVTWTSHMLDWALFEADPRGHHATSLALHLAATLLLFVILERTSGAIFPSAFAAALFGVHPLHVESVAWVAERKDVLSTLLWMVATLAYVRYARTRSVRAYLLALVALFLGLASKPMLVTLPVTLLLLDYWPLGRFGSGSGAEGRRRAWELVREKLPLLALSVGSSLLAIFVQHSGQALRSLDQLSTRARLSNAIVSYVVYLWNTLWPRDLAAFYPHPGESLALWKPAAALALLALITLFAFRQARRRPYLIVGWLWYLITLLPVSGIVQVGSHGRADRFTYVPLIGIFIAIAWGSRDLFAHWSRRPSADPARGGGESRPWLLACLVVVGLLVPVTRAQVRLWRDSETLFRHALAVTSANAKAHDSLGAALSEQGRVDEAIEHYREAIRINPGYGRAHNSLGVALAARGHHAEAETHYRAALRSEPGQAQVHVNLGNALNHQGRYPEALAEFAEAIRTDPEFVPAYYNLGVALAAQGRLEEAAEQYRIALRIDPEDARSHNNLGNALARSGATEEAIFHYTRAIELEPDHAKAHANLAAALFFAGRYAEAWEEVSRARRLGFEPPAPLVRSLTEALQEPPSPD